MANRGAIRKPLDESLSSGLRNKRPKCLNSNKVSSNSVVASEDGFTNEEEIASNIKKFLELGLMDGVVVICFPHRPDVFHSDGTSGIIIGNEIHCLCKVCERPEENHKMSPTVFEIHAGSRKKHPAENFYLADLKTTIKDIMNKCKDNLKQIWGTIIKELIGDINGQKIVKVCTTCEVSIEDHYYESKVSGLRLPTKCATSRGSAQPREESFLNVLLDGSALNYFGDYEPREESFLNVLHDGSALNYFGDYEGFYQPREESFLNVLPDESELNYSGDGDYENKGSEMTKDEVLGLLSEDPGFNEYFKNLTANAGSDADNNDP